MNDRCFVGQFRVGRIDVRSFLGTDDLNLEIDVRPEQKIEIAVELRGVAHSLAGLGVNLAGVLVDDADFDRHAHRFVEGEAIEFPGGSARGDGHRSRRGAAGLHLKGGRAAGGDAWRHRRRRERNPNFVGFIVPPDRNIAGGGDTFGVGRDQQRHILAGLENERIFRGVGGLHVGHGDELEVDVRAVFEADVGHVDKGVAGAGIERGERNANGILNGRAGLSDESIGGNEDLRPGGVVGGEREG